MPSPTTIFLGPLLGYERGDCYTVCLLADATLAAPVLTISTGAPVQFAFAGDTPSGRFWRAEVLIAPGAAGPQQRVKYSIAASGAALADRGGRAEWTFYVPAAGERARLAYAACNGFSSQKLAEQTARPYAMWEKLRALHEEALQPQSETSPFSLLLMGGDQLYADSVLGLPGVREWTEKSHEDMMAYEPSDQLITRLDRFYDQLYQDRWANRDMALMFASIPSVMMWDDHDIIDGWGSHADVPQGTPMYAAIYAAARKYFQLYQLRTAANRSLLDAAQVNLPDERGQLHGHFSLAFDFADFRVLAMDHRSERSLTQVMSDDHHRTVKAWIAGVPAEAAPRPVLALSGIPVVYRSFAALESTMEFTPWTEEATDDVRDHWMAAHHRGERIRLVKNLFACAAPVWLLSGDVHVGALGAIRDAESGRSIYQVVSTGIVHPPPGPIAWAGLRLLTNDDPEALPGTKISTEMLTPNNSPRYIRDRNFATLQRDDRGKVWVHWICETLGQPKPPEFVASDNDWPAV
jgi:PhoD related phosphatase